MPRIKKPVSSRARTDAAIASTAAPKASSATAPAASSTITLQAPSSISPATASRPRRKARLDVDAVATTPPTPTSKALTSKSKETPSKSKPAASKSPASQSTASKSLATKSLTTKSPASSASTAKPSRPTPRASSGGLSALDAAAQVLAGLSKAEAREGVTASDLIERMTAAKLWTSPGGKTPAATLYSAMIREIARKGDASRFARIAPGRFVAGAAKPTRAPKPTSSKPRTASRTEVAA
jgi:hypothetical protein